MYSDGFSHTYYYNKYGTAHCVLSGVTGRILNYDVFLSINVVLILANSYNPDEMPHYAAFHLGLHCLPKYLFRGFPSAKA